MGYHSKLTVSSLLVSKSQDLVDSKIIARTEENRTTDRTKKIRNEKYPDHGSDHHGPAIRATVLE